MQTMFCALNNMKNCTIWQTAYHVILQYEQCKKVSIMLVIFVDYENQVQNAVRQSQSPNLRELGHSNSHR